MTEEERKMRRTWLGAAFSGLLVFIATFAAMLLLYGCGTARRAAQSHASIVQDTLIRQTIRIDSVCKLDSVYIRDRGDTLIKTVTRWRVRDRLIRDTLRISVHDTVRIDKVIEQEVPQPLTWWQRLWITSGKIVWVAAVLFLLFIVTRTLL